VSLQTRLSDLILAVGTDYKQLRTWISGSSTGTLTGLATTDKTSIVAALNEVNARATGAPPTASETTLGSVRLATQAETDVGTNDVNVVTPLKFTTRLKAYAQPLSTTLSDLAAQANQTAFGRSLLSVANAAGLIAILPPASQTVVGVHRFSTQAEVDAGVATDTAVIPATLQARLVAFAQPLSANLTALAGVASGAFGRTLLGSTTAAAAKTSLGLATVATTGSAADLTGVLPSSALPPLAISDTFPVASQAAMLALTAQRGDIAIRTDINRSFILTADAPATLTNWTQLTAGGDVLSVAGKTGAVALVKADVGLANVDNTADLAKPVSTATTTALDLRMLKTANLSDVADLPTAQTNLSVYSRAALGDPETDLTAAYTAAKA
jgi:hypothetical protein